MKYRYDIDGLRAFAVLLVIAFHFEITPWLTGGFIGVDVFFVISGFLITQVIVHHLREETFSFSGFYLRRAKRLLPAFYAMTLFSLLLGYLIFSPNDLAGLGHALRYAVTFHVNHFLANQSGYFAPDASLQPLLHVWSLNVEEQFYFVWPFLVVLAYRSRFFSKTSYVAFGLILVSVVLSQYWLYTLPSHAYFQLPSRAFEMLAGAWLALVIHELPLLSEHKAKLCQNMSLVGLLFVAILFDRNTSFPGLNALYPTLLTMLFLYAGHCRLNATWIAARVPRLLGQMSYSLYLWHWPLWVFGLYLIEMTMVIKAGLILGTFLLSFFSWKYIETPLRHKYIQRRRSVFIYYFVLPVLLFLAASQWLEKTNGLPSRLTAEAQRANAQIMSEPIEKTYDLSPNVLIWGDSHGAHLRGMMEYLKENYQVRSRILGAGGCLPLVGVLNSKESDQNCLNSNISTMALIKDIQPSVVLIGARWGNYVQMVNDPAYGTSLEAEFSEGVTPISKAEFLKKALLTTIDSIEASGDTRIVIMSSIPTYPFNAANCAIRRYMKMGKSDCTIDKAEFLDRQVVVRKVLSEVIQLRPKVTLIDPSLVLCDATRCHVEIEGVVLYMDNNHLNLDASRWLGEKMDQLGMLEALK
ncbi:acyltransferase family protein [Vibrio methylphosphonaticus]|uniref:acyltransferase family protein n=1 Tax=Vibrio methylphosphonaticus TaxID=2946866 RepID=UPI002029EDD9|nr:acyltransferase family protein [Vibrio methylphosphonaticus]MCL9777511.1 acyltransferase [Vibrio methylphosphonaticus]